jgi:hypothetical protein
MDDSHKGHLPPLIFGCPGFPLWLLVAPRGLMRMAHVGQKATPCVHAGPLGQVGPLWGVGASGSPLVSMPTLLQNSNTLAKFLNFFQNPKTPFLCMNLNPLTIPKLLVMSSITFETPKKFGLTIKICHYYPSVIDVKCVTL